ncbi:MAG: ribonuclease P protein subunit [Methanobacteriota archaeon]
MSEYPLVKDEFIGRTVTIRECTDPTGVGFSGVILDETKHTFLIERGNTQRRIAKTTASFEFTENGHHVIVQGIRLIHRPEDRIKKSR